MSGVENHDFGSVGKCIYCGAESELTTEHIIPFGLGGKSILHGASCKKCAAITSKFERDVLKGTYNDFRISWDFPSRKKKERPKTLILNVEPNEGEKRN